LRAMFTKFRKTELIGIEVETAALDPATGASLPYHGSAGIAALLSRLADELDGTRQYDGDHLVGIELPGGGTISLEHGGAVEYSSPPAANVAELVSSTYEILTRIAEAARRLNIAIVPGANYPFTRADEIQWMPITRGAFMRQHFASLGEAGKHGPDIMSRALSVQVSFDYTAEVDMVEKFRMQSMASTPATALFVNSPLADGQLTGGLSKRMDYWAYADPARSRVNPVTLSEALDIDAFIDWALGLPMIHRQLADGSRKAASAIPFAELLATGFGDGTMPGSRDWTAHLSQIFPDVRLRETLEVRAVDGPPFSALATIPAFWTGLTYHRPSRLAVIEMMHGISRAQHLSALDDIARRGLNAELAGRPVREYAVEILRVADAGLRALVASGREPGSVISYLDPLHEIAATGLTFAEICAGRWQGALACSPERFVEAYRI
jgi:glutamate--cysteine ligase